MLKTTVAGTELSKEFNELKSCLVNNEKFKTKSLFLIHSFLYTWHIYEGFFHPVQ